MTYYCCFSDSDFDEKSENGSDDTPIEEMCDILPFLLGHLRILQTGLAHNIAVIQPAFLTLYNYNFWPEIPPCKRGI